MVEWKDIPGFEGRYQASSDGQVRTLRYTNRMTDMVLAEPRILTKRIRRRYWSVHLSQNDERKDYHIHNLVLLAFVGPRPDGTECRHLDGNRYNNAVANLAYGTRQENAQDRKLHGTSRGEANPRHKLTTTLVTRIREEYRAGGVTQRELAKRYSVTKSCIGDVVSGRRWGARLALEALND